MADEEFAAAQAAPAAEVSGESAVSKAVEQNELAEADMAAPLPLTTAAPGADGTGSVAGATAAVTTVGDKAFVLKEGVWTDTTFDPSVMTTTKLPFPSDLFLEFLGDHSAAGKYFALGQRVIVVLDGVAYETVEGDPAELSQPDEAEVNSAQPAPIEPTEGQPQPDESSPPASLSHLTLTADVTEGVAPLEVNFSGSLVAGPADGQNYACLPGQFEFGDGNSLTIMSECGGEPNERRDTANYIYDQAGEYQVTFTLGEIKSEPVTIIVKEAADSVSVTEEPKVLVAQPTPETREPVKSNQAVTESNSSPYNFWGLLLLPLLGLAIGWFIWGRGRK